jgi:hypothetical protein
MQDAGLRRHRKERNTTGHTVEGERHRPPPAPRLARMGSEEEAPHATSHHHCCAIHAPDRRSRGPPMPRSGPNGRPHPPEQTTGADQHGQQHLHDMPTRPHPRALLAPLTRGHRAAEIRRRRPRDGSHDEGLRAARGPASIVSSTGFAGCVLRRRRGRRDGGGGVPAAAS